MVDPHTLATLLFRFWSVLAGGVTVLLIPFCLDPVQQGYFYSFASILALQVFFELGMNQVVIQIIAHEVAHIRKDKIGIYEGPAEHIARVAQFKDLIGRWYLIASILFLILASTAGLLFFHLGELAWNQWAIQWCSLVCVTAMNLFLSWKLAFVEGFTRVRDVNQLRLKQSILGYLLMWALLFSGGGLWVVAVVPMVSSLMTAWWLTKQPASGILSIRSSASCIHPILWRRDVFPFQWRIAVSWVSGYFLSNLFTPLIFSSQGAFEAGRLGLALSIFSAISTIGMSWVSAKIPDLSNLIARRDSVSLLILFKSVAIRSVVTTAAITFIVLISAWLATIHGLSLMYRVASLPVLMCLALVSVANSGIFAVASFVRAHKEEPLLAMSITSGLMTALTVWLCAPLGAITVMASYLAITILVALPWTLYVLKSYISRHKNSISFNPQQD